MSPSCAWLGNASPRSTSLDAVSRGRTLRSSVALGGSKSLSFLHGPSRRSRPCAAAAVADDSIVLATSASAPSMFQITAKGWLASYDNQLSQNFWTQPQRQVGPGGPGRSSTEGERLPPVASVTARRENYKKEHYSKELDRIVKNSDGPVGARALLNDCPERVQNLEQPTKEVKSFADIGTEIDKLLQSVHDKHRHFMPERLLLEKERRQQERQQEPDHHQKSEPSVRRPRKRSDQPGNPKWRVEERLKRERELMKDTGEPPMGTDKLPMTQFAVQGDTGKKEYALVDVKGIQAKCKGLSANCSAKSMLEDQRQREEAAVAKKSLAATREHSCRAELDALASLSWEDRVELAQRRKLQGHISSVFDKMQAMRSKYPKQVPDSIVNHLHAMHAGDFSWHEPYVDDS